MFLNTNILKNYRSVFVFKIKYFEFLLGINNRKIFYCVLQLLKMTDPFHIFMDLIILYFQKYLTEISVLQ
jgi:hypothetical protein